MAERPFRAVVHGPIVTLVFGDRHTQHAALARLETFYESEKFKSVYLSLETAEREKLCRGYEAFNLPMQIFPAWIKAMCAKEEVAPTAEMTWHEATCTAEESALLRYLIERDVLDSTGTSLVEHAPTYLISALTTSAETVFAHERLHALYHFSAPYRALLAELWEGMPGTVKDAVQFDMQMRGYSATVWQDELGAYLGVRVPQNVRAADPSVEFGKKSAETCREIRRALLAHIPRYWRESAGVEEQVLQLAPEFLLQARTELRPKPKVPVAKTRKQKK
ncbi:enhancer of mRNA decapping [Malassezia vespertilionis]|uniref:Uncharacterized protein n=1 Tax=Malassezia vespertilionis TaxID=2020962 RepID=A0A2N1JG25_9BASI|nr:enhancer of mRNA decapping [Malassezia vespertilionis]PKI85501.1 hypothetical protein MVES_000458 [Malassezia vespertilionis]WFD05170.1 enhancer of mRNA decapping [Malassezia vespertilionis]